MNDLILDSLKEIGQLQKDVKLNRLVYKTKSGKKSTFKKVSMPITFLRNILGGVLSIEDTDKEQNKLFTELSNANKMKNQSRTRFF